MTLPFERKGQPDESRPYRGNRLLAHKAANHAAYEGCSRKVAALHGNSPTGRILRKRTDPEYPSHIPTSLKLERELADLETVGQDREAIRLVLQEVANRFGWSVVDASREGRTATMESVIAELLQHAGGAAASIIAALEDGYITNTEAAQLDEGLARLADTIADARVAIAGKLNQQD